MSGCRKGESRFCRSQRFSVRSRQFPKHKAEKCYKSSDRRVLRGQIKLAAKCPDVGKENRASADHSDFLSGPVNSRSIKRRNVINRPIGGSFAGRLNWLRNVRMSERRIALLPITAIFCPVPSIPEA